MRSFILICFVVSSAFACLAQHKAMNVYTTEQGLPSNVTYQTLEDNRGFLWVTTDQGIARFDGKNFQVFAKEQGVPDIEVIQILKEKNGRIWIRCYNNSLAFYDAIKNRFVDVTAIANSLHIKGIKKMSAIPDGGIQFDTETGSFQFKDENLLGMPLRSSSDSTFIIRTDTDGIQFTYSYNESSAQDSSVHIYLMKGKTIWAQRSLGFLGRGLVFSLDGNSLYIFKHTSNEYYVVTGFDKSIQQVNVQKHTLLHEYYIHHFTDKYLNLLCRTKDTVNGKDVMEVNVYDKKTFRFLFRVNESFIAFHLLNDRKGNLWVSTLDKGLCMFPIQSAVKQCVKDLYKDIDFYCVTRSAEGILYAGNEKGEVVEINHDIQKVNKVATNGKIEWQRNIILSQHKIFTFSDGGVFVNYRKEIINKSTNTHQESKVVLALNDSIVISGSGSGLSHLNTIKEELSILRNTEKPVTALASIDHNDFYIGSTDGLHVYKSSEHKVIDLNKTEPLLAERIVAMRVTDDSLLWIATATDGIVVVKNGKVFRHIREIDGLSSNNTLAITKGTDKQVWIGTNLGVSRLNYSMNESSMSFIIQNISTIDGLTSNIINQLFYDNHILFAATERGVCMISDSIPVPDIHVELTGIRINQKDTSLLADYSLKADQKNIKLQFAGVDLRGYFNHVDYSSDYGKTWVNTDGGNLSLEFENGLHPIWVRAVDVNKHPGSKILKLQFDIATPYWKTWWFWTGIVLLIQLLVGYLFYRRQKQKEKEKKKVELAKAHLASLEQQAFVSLMNPHFMFNALNSIQHYINNQDRQNANRFLTDFASLIRKNFEAAQQAFIPLEQEMENISLYLRLEKMRFNDKFDFEIIYDDDLDPDDWMMPTMILQPLVENSILHGIMPSQIHGLLKLRLSYQGQDLLLEVIDNGIGIENSRAMKQGSKHRSRGMELIHKRLQALSFFSSQELKLEYSVPYNDTRNPGNKTSLLIPYGLHQAWGNAQKNIER